MKFLFDLFPVILFFVIFKYYDGNHILALAQLSQFLGWIGASTSDIPASSAPLLLATMTVIIATGVQIIWVKFRHGRVDSMLWVSLGLVVFLGGMTLVFHDERFIKWKPTALYWLFALALIIAYLGFRRNLIRTMMAKQLTLPDPIWTRLNWAWAVFFTGLGALNLWVAFHFPTDTWVNFKLFGTTGLLITFIVLQGFWLSRYLPPGENS